MIGGLSHRSLKKESFTGQMVSWRAFKNVLTALMAANYIEAIKGNWTEFFTPNGDADGVWAKRHAARLAPTDKLRDAAADAGIALTDLPRHFVTDPDADLKETSPVIRRYQRGRLEN
jgi:hypothetical protein